MTRTARLNRDDARSTKTLPASTWDQLRPGASDAFKFGVKTDSKNKSSIDKKQERSENRRVKRIVGRELGRSCFHCRGEGHVVADCPQMKNAVDHGSGVCFKCGSTEHSLTQCRAKVAGGKLPFAKCFVCGEMGHLSKSCPDNPRGLYPLGGGCDICGSVEHFKKDCTETKMPSTGAEEMTLAKMDRFTNVEEELAFQPARPPKPSGKKVKLVKF